MKKVFIYRTIVLIVAALIFFLFLIKNIIYTYQFKKLIKITYLFYDLRTRYSLINNIFENISLLINYDNLFILVKLLFFVFIIGIVFLKRKNFKNVNLIIFTLIIVFFITPIFIPKKYLAERIWDYQRYCYIKFPVRTDPGFSGWAAVSKKQNKYYFFFNHDICVLDLNTKNNIKSIYLYKEIKTYNLYKPQEWQKEAKKEYLGLNIGLNDDRNELYVYSKTKKQLIIINTLNDKIVTKIEIPGINGDPIFVPNAEYLFFVDNKPSIIAKLNLNTRKILIKDFPETNTALALDLGRGCIYTNKIKISDGEKQNGYFIYKLSADNLSLIKKINVPQAVYDILISRDNSKMYCLIPMAGVIRSYVFIYDLADNKIMNKIKVPFLARDIAIDYRHDLLFAVTPLGNIIKIIDLNNARTIGYIKAGDYSARFMAIDENNMSLFLSTQCFGLYKYNYKNIYERYKKSKLLVFK